MTTSGGAATGASGLIERGLCEAQRRSGLPVAFGGLVDPSQRHFTITALRGMSTGSLANLRVRNGEGLGGAALARQRPVSVVSYPRARGITRRYEQAVAPERLQSILSVPVGLPGRSPIAVLYLAAREESGFGDAVQERLRPVVTQLAHDLEVAADVERQVQVLRADLVRSAPLGTPDVRDDLAALMDATTDPHTRDGLRKLLAQMRALPRAHTEGVASPLTRREAEVLAQVDRGASNLQIAQALGLTEGTVKSYMKAVLAKVGADNRVRACRVAREQGWLR